MRRQGRKSESDKPVPRARKGSRNDSAVVYREPVSVVPNASRRSEPSRGRRVAASPGTRPSEPSSERRTAASPGVRPPELGWNRRVAAPPGMRPPEPSRGRRVAASPDMRPPEPSRKRRAAASPDMRPPESSRDRRSVVASAVRRRKSPPTGRSAPHLSPHQSTLQRRRKIRRRLLWNRVRAFLTSAFIVVILAGTILTVGKIFSEVRSRPILAFVSNGEIEEALKLSGYIVRSEILITAPQAGYVQPAVPEGTRLAYGQEAALMLPERGIAQMEQYNDLRRQIDQRRLDLLDQQSAGEVLRRYDQADIKLQDPIAALQRQAMKGQLRELEAPQAAIELVLDQREADLEKIDFGDEILSELHHSADVLRRQIREQSAGVLTTIPGVVSFHSDGNEAKVDFAGINELPTADLLGVLEKEPEFINLADQTVEREEPVCRIVDSAQQYFVFVLPSSYAGLASCPGEPTPSPGENTELAPLRHGVRLSLFLPGQLQQINDALITRLERLPDQRILLVCRTLHGMESLLNRRTVEADLVLRRRSGLMVPLSSILRGDKDSKVGEIMVVRSGSIVRVPVEIKLSNDNSAIIVCTDEKNKVESGNVVVTNPENVKEGEPLR
ncbi:MAG: hypothetical protein GX900_02730 [Clostridiaceae bacterium]|nr:hypothetical protein [Clostridiaceae bacterium]